MMKNLCLEIKQGSFDDDFEDTGISPPKLKIEITFDNQIALDKCYNKLIEQGYNCKIV